VIALVVIAAAVVAGCGSGASSPDSRAAPAAVRDISSVLDLRAAFNEDRGSPRLLLLLSPT
jgi:hypothetical protein